MAEVASVSLNWDAAKISTANAKAVKGLFRMGFDVASQARRNAPYLTGALRSTIRVEETADKSVEVIAGGSFAGKKVDYALLREEGPNRDPSTVHYLENALTTIVSGDYINRYFGEILR